MCMLCSCLSNRKSVYLQDKTQKRPHKTEVNHQFQDAFAPLRFERGDVLSVNISYYELTKNGEARMDSDEPMNRSVEHPYLSGYRVDDSLNINLPVIGAVKVGGLTAEEAEAKILEKATSFYSNPNVKIFLMNFRVTVLGEVGRPGSFDVYNNKISVFEALGLANDMLPYADRESVAIQRSRGGQNHLYYIDLTDETLLASGNLYLQPNDVIMVKAMGRKKYTLNDSQGVVRALSVVLSIGSIMIALNRNNR